MDRQTVAGPGVVPDQVLGPRAVGQALLFGRPARRFERQQFALEGFEHVGADPEVDRREHTAVHSPRSRRARSGIPVHHVRPGRPARHPVPHLLVEPDGFAVGQGIKHIPAVQADMAAAPRSIHTGLGMKGSGEGAVVAVGVSVVVFGPGTECAGKGLPIDKNLLVPFPPPDENVIGDLIDRTDNLALTRRGQEIRVEVRPRIPGQRPPLGAQMIAAAREGQRADLQRKLHGIGNRTGVAQSQVHGLLERHQQPAGHFPVFLDGEEQVFVRIDARRRAEKVAQRHSNALFAVEIYPEKQKPVCVVGPVGVVPIPALLCSRHTGGPCVDGFFPGYRGQAEGLAGGDRHILFDPFRPVRCRGGLRVGQRLGNPGLDGSPRIDLPGIERLDRGSGHIGAVAYFIVQGERFVLFFDGDLERFCVRDRIIQVAARAADVREHRPEGFLLSAEERFQRGRNARPGLSVEIKPRDIGVCGVGRPEPRDGAGTRQVRQNVLLAPVCGLGAHIPSPIQVVEPRIAALVAFAAVAAGRGLLEKGFGPSGKILEIRHLQKKVLDIDGFRGRGAAISQEQGRRGQKDQHTFR